MSTDPSWNAHRRVVAHLQALDDAFDLEEMGEAVDWGKVGEGASAPYDGCIDCIVREVLTVGINSLVEDRAIVVKRDEEP